MENLVSKKRKLEKCEVDDMQQQLKEKYSAQFDDGTACNFQNDAYNYMVDTVLEEIFSFLTSTSDLLACRLVSKNWHDASTKIIIRRSLGAHYLKPQLKFDTSYSSPTFVLQPWWKRKTLKMLNDCLDTASSINNNNNDTDHVNMVQHRFPCAKFYFSCDQPKNIELHFKGVDFQYFFHHHGHLVKHLILSLGSRILYSNNITYTADEILSLSDSLEAVLKGCGGNLEELVIMDIPRDLGSLSAVIENCIVLHNLKKLSLGHWVNENVTLLKQLLLKSPNLQEFSDVIHSQNLDVFVCTKKLFTITHFVFDLNSYGIVLENMEKLAAAHPRLEFLGFNSNGIFKNNFTTSSSSSLDLKKSSGLVLIPILNSSKTSLKKIECSSFDLFLLAQLETTTMKNNNEKAVFPVLKRMTEIQMDDFSTLPPNDLRVQHLLTQLESSVPWFKNFSQTLPALHTVSLDANTHLSELLFPSFDPVNSVRVLYVGRDPSPNFLSRVASLFPKVDLLTLETKNFSRVANCVWAYSSLTSLKLEFLDNSTHDNCSPRLDAAFTGFSEPVVERLALELEDEEEEEKDEDDLSQLRINPSILDVKGLTRLKVKLNAYDNEDALTWPCLLTQVTGTYAFALMPGLKVEMCPRNQGHPTGINRSALAPILPFVHLESGAHLVDSDSESSPDSSSEATENEESDEDDDSDDDQDENENNDE